MLSIILEDLKKITPISKEISVHYLMRKYRLTVKQAILYAKEYANGQILQEVDKIRENPRERY